MALSSLKGLPEGEAKASLVAMVEYVLELSSTDGRNVCWRARRQASAWKVKTKGTFYS